MILNFHRFPVGFEGDPEIHQKLVDYLTTELDGFMAPDTFGGTVTLGQLWEGNYQVILAYNEQDRASYSQYLWEGIEQKWPDVQNAEALGEYLHKIMPLENHPKNIWSAMAELTPTFFYYIFRPTYGLRKMADEVNRNVTSWVRDDFWRLANIVATDFFLGNNIIEVSIEANLKREICKI